MKKEYICAIFKLKIYILPKYQTFDQNTVKLSTEIIFLIEVLFY